MKHAIAAARSLCRTDNHKLVRNALRSKHTDPIVRNAIEFMGHNLPRSNRRLESLERFSHVQHYWSNALNHLTLAALPKIRNGSVIATYGYSERILHLLQTAIVDKKFSLHAIDDSHTSGYMMAQAAVKTKIPVLHFNTSAARQALKQADLVLLDATTITRDGRIVGQMGVELVAETAHRHGSAVYIVACGWQYDSHRSFRYEDTKSHKTHRGLEENQLQFETVDPKAVTGIVSEIGIHKPAHFMHSVKRAYPWMKTYF